MELLESARVAKAAGIWVQVLMGSGGAWEDLARFLGSSGVCWVLVESGKAKWSPEGCGKTWWGLVGPEGQPSVPVKSGNI